MRLEGGEGGKLRSQPPEAAGSERAVPGTFYPRLCVCPACHSKSTSLRGSDRGTRYMECRRCGKKFKAGSP